MVMRWVWPAHHGREKLCRLHVHLDHVVFVLVVGDFHVVASSGGHAPSPSPTLVVRYGLHLQGFKVHHDRGLVPRDLLHLELVGRPGGRRPNVCSLRRTRSTGSFVGQQRLQAQGRIKSALGLCCARGWRGGGRRGEYRRDGFVLVRTDVLYPPVVAVVPRSGWERRERGRGFEVLWRQGGRGSLLRWEGRRQSGSTGGGEHGRWFL